MTKYIQLLEILTLHKVDICGVTETGYLKAQQFKLNHYLIIPLFGILTLTDMQK